MDWHVTRDGWMKLANTRVRAALGRGGSLPEADKVEGDGATPLGRYPLRFVMYRADRGPAPITALPTRKIGSDDGWCDAVDDAAYNRPVRLPYPVSCETLFREDGLYDIIVVLGHNDDPAISGLGSAVFLHCKRGNYEPTLGCVALAPEDVRTWLEQVQRGDYIVIS
ncbi:MAG: L,D-transpeptidase family protein [Maricaulis sp.]|jgi:L,D-peptidoglycan transpeptidase YkuD (ErfK/YbiS/YcfS/YnhG family)|nr:L,D-transpeptidase family protein [Maricaulis sp.]